VLSIIKNMIMKKLVRKKNRKVRVRRWMEINIKRMRDK
jgi:hypothetical protein